jgi:Enoyl-CoA hydratase/isomerase
VATIRFEQDGGIGSIVLANPPFNRIGSAFALNLRDAVHRASESNIRVLVVRAEGPNFSFGAAVNEWPGKDANWFRTFIAELNQSYRALETLRVPTLAAVQSAARLRGHARHAEGLEQRGVAAADAVMLDLTIDLFSSADATKGFAETAKAIEENVERRALTFEGR